MEVFFDNLFEDIRHERSLILLLSLTDPDIVKKIQCYQWWNQSDKKTCSWNIIKTQNGRGIYVNTVVRIG